MLSEGEKKLCPKCKKRDAVFSARTRVPMSGMASGGDYKSGDYVPAWSCEDRKDCRYFEKI